jgi:hypothetical protein
MSQAADLGAIANVPGASFRARVNAGFQAVTSWHYGPSAPTPTYPLMLWGDQSTGKVWLRDAANAAWAEVGLLGPPFSWTAVAGGAGGGASTGDVKPTFRTAVDDGWVLMNDGSIGPGRLERHQPRQRRLRRPLRPALGQRRQCLGAAAELERNGGRARRLGGGRLGGQPAAGPAEDAGPGDCLCRLGRGPERPDAR